MYGATARTTAQLGRVGHDLDGFGRVVGRDPADPEGARSAQSDRSPAHQCTSGAGCDHLPLAHRLPVEPVARALSRRELGASHLPALGAPGGLRADLGGARRAL